MSRINKLTNSFIKITNALDKTKKPGRVQHLRVDARRRGAGVSQVRPAAAKYNNRQQLPSPTDTDESKPEKKRRGRKNKVAEDDVVMSEPTTSEETTLPPSPA